MYACIILFGTVGVVSNLFILSMCIVYIVRECVVFRLSLVIANLLKGLAGLAASWDCPARAFPV